MTLAQFPTNDTFDASAGDYEDDPTRVAPPADVLANGFLPDAEVKAEELNHVMSEILNRVQELEQTLASAYLTRWDFIGFVQIAQYVYFTGEQKYVRVRNGGIDRQSSSGSTFTLVQNYTSGNLYVPATNGTRIVWSNGHAGSVYWYEWGDGSRTESTVDTNVAPRGVAYDDVNDKWIVAVGDNQVSGENVYNSATANSESWTARDSGLGTNNIDYIASNGGTTIIAVGSGSVVHYSVSTDGGDTWSASSFSVPGVDAPTVRALFPIGDDAIGIAIRGSSSSGRFARYENGAWTTPVNSSGTLTDTPNLGYVNQAAAVGDVVIVGHRVSYDRGDNWQSYANTRPSIPPGDYDHFVSAVNGYFFMNGVHSKGGMD